VKYCGQLRKEKSWSEKAIFGGYFVAWYIHFESSVFLRGKGRNRAAMHHEQKLLFFPSAVF